MPGVATESLAVALEEFDFTMDGEHFFNKRSAKMQEAKRE